MLSTQLEGLQEKKWLFLITKEKPLEKIALRRRSQLSLSCSVSEEAEPQLSVWMAGLAFVEGKFAISSADTFLQQPFPLTASLKHTSINDCISDN